MRNSMDYIYASGEQKIVIEIEQKNIRQSVIEQYVRCRKIQGMTQADLAKCSGVIYQVTELLDQVVEA